MSARFWIAALLAASVGHAVAAGPAAVRKQIESSLLVKGTIDITAEGRVVEYALEGKDALADSVIELIDSAVPHWRFEPVELRNGTTRARASMSVRLVAKKLDDDSYMVALRGAQFGNDAPGESPAGKDMRPPAYPQNAVRAGVGGTVYTVLRVGRDGRVEEAIAEQVNLRVVASEAAMEQWRRTLAKAALQTARRWTFDPPTKGEEVDAPYWSVRVPVDFVAPGTKEPKASQWHAYIPGPRERIPWKTDEGDAGADALAAGGVYPVGRGPRLLTALGGG